MSVAGSVLPLLFPIIKPAQLKATESDSVAETFSLPLTGMEKFHRAADTPAYPNTIFCRMRFAGRIDQRIARETLKCLLKRHWLLQKTIKGSGLRQKWVPDDDLVDVALDDELAKMMTWNCAAADCHFMADDFAPQLLSGNEESVVPQINIESQRGIHMWVFAGPNNTMILAGIHHAVGDGGGGVQLLSDFVHVYDNLYANRDWDYGLRQLNPSLLKQRGDIGLLRWNYLQHLWKQPIALFGFFKFMRNKFQTFSPNKHTLTPATNFPGIVGRWISSDDSVAIQASANRNKVPVNSVVMAAVFRACQRWLGGRGNGNDAGWIRMLLPISYRNKSDLRLPVTNKTTIVQIDRRYQQMHPSETFLHYLNREINIVVGWQFHKLFLMAIESLSWLPGGLQRAANTPIARGTIVFTNLGTPFRFKKFIKRNAIGPLNWVDFDFVGPIRPKMPVNFTLQRHHQQYRLSLHFDRRALTQATAEAFLASIEAELSDPLQKF